VLAYQRVQRLTIGELWAVAITLRIVMVENLRRLAEQMVRGRVARSEADALADRILGLGGRTPPDLGAELAGFEHQPLPTSFAVQLVQRLREPDPALVPALHWLEEKLAAQGTTSEEIVRREHHRQAAMNVTVRNLITSMRLMSTIDWKEFFESFSRVDEVLRDATNFAALDFTTRDLYRHVVEDLARGSGSSELEVTQLVVERSRRGAQDAASPERHGDPGFYLLGKGRTEIERELRFRLPPQRWLARAYLAVALPGYVTTVALLSALVLVVPLLFSALAGAGPLTVLLLAVLAFVPTTDLAVALANLGVVQRIGPRHLPRLELRDGVPAALRTLVVIPVLLSSEAVVDELIASLEVHYLANPDRELYFALLSNWTDAPPETRPDDERLLLRTSEGIARLNARHVQPRVTPTLPTDREGSLYQWITAGPCGIDPYVSAVSDVYQDLFAEGSYTGKGIHDVDAFEAALAGRVPDDALLSHDLFEGIFARAGLTTQVSFFEAFPTLPGGRPAPAPLGARRLAAAAVDLRLAAPRRPVPRTLEDGGQPTSHAVGTALGFDAARCLTSGPSPPTPPRRRDERGTRSGRTSPAVRPRPCSRSADRPPAPSYRVCGPLPLPQPKHS